MACGDTLETHRWPLWIPALVCISALATLTYCQVIAVLSGHTAVDLPNNEDELERFVIWCPSIGLSSNQFPERSAYTGGMALTILIMLGCFPYILKTFRAGWSYVTPGVVHRVDQPCDTSGGDCREREPPVFALERTNSMPNHTKSSLQGVLGISLVFYALSMVASLVQCTNPMREDLLYRIIRFRTGQIPRIYLASSTLINIKSSTCFFMCAVAHMLLVAVGITCCTKGPIFTNGSIAAKIVLLLGLLVPHLFPFDNLRDPEVPELIFRLNMDGLLQRWTTLSYYLFLGSYCLDFHSTNRYYIRQTMGRSYRIVVQHPDGTELA